MNYRQILCHFTQLLCRLTALTQRSKRAACGSIEWVWYRRSRTKKSKEKKKGLATLQPHQIGIYKGNALYHY